MTTPKVNDIVRFLNQVGGGKIARIEGNMAYVEDEDGFEQPVMLRECVVVEQAKAKPSAYDRPIMPAPSKLAPPEPKPAPSAAPKVVETPDGDTMNVVLAFEPKEIKHINTTSYLAYLVNDSNYFLYFSYMTRGDDSGDWTLRFHDLVEPNMQVFVEEFQPSQLNQMDRIAVQLIAFKQGKGFKLKNPVLVEHRLDPTKFFKMHCFRATEYFETPVMQFDIVRHDLAARPLVVDSADLERAMREKRPADQPTKTPVKKTEQPKPDAPIVVDLHIHELLDNTNGLSNSDMLEVQLNKFRQVMQENCKHKGKKIVFIHGKGEGVLRRAIVGELRYKYRNCSVQDASFREYGFGATQVVIH